MTAALHRPPREPHVPPSGSDLHELDMTATFAADVTLRDAQARLAAIGQWLPVDGDPASPLGTLVDENSTGPLRLGYGAWRDLLLGVQFRNGREELISAGGRTVKNVAGYDLTKLMVGQHGAFGRPVTLTTRTYRRPAGAVLATFPPDIARLPELLPSPLRPQWAVLTASALHCGYLGDDQTLAFYADRLRVLSPASLARRNVDDDADHRRSLWCVGSPQAFRASLPPADVLRFSREAGIELWSADAAFGIVVGPIPLGGPERIVKAAAALGGSVKTVDRTAEPPRMTFSRVSPVERAVLSQLKSAFDPDGSLEQIDLGYSVRPVPSPGTPGEG
jgi:hypothetical protein